jgi:hypothetical protein
MIRIAHIADSHANESSRFNEHNRIMSWIGEDAAERGVSLFLHAGDVWERRSSSVERLAVADYTRQWASLAPMVVVAGNHDDPLDIEWLGRLRTTHPVIALTRPEVVTVAGCTISCMPWPDRGRVLAANAGASKDVLAQIAAAAMQDILRGMGLHESTGPRLFLGHCSMRGSRVSALQPPLVGCDFELGATDLALVRASFYALGHIHMGDGNEWDIGGSPVRYASSPRRCNFGETDPKGYVIITFDGDKLVDWERIPTPCNRMEHIELWWDAAQQHFNFEDGGLYYLPGCDELSNTETRLRYHTAADQREAAARSAAEIVNAMKAAGAITVQVEPCVTTTNRARAPEVAAAHSITDKLVAYWASIKWDPGDRMSSLCGKASELEAEERNAEATD